MLKQLFQSISSKEWWFVGFISLVLIIVTTAPAIYGWAITSEDRVFTAMHFVSADDWFVYYSFINQGAEGSLLFKDLFAPVDHVPVLRPFWLMVGLFAGLFNLSAPVAFHLARIALIPIFCFMVYLLLAYILRDIVKRKFALAFLSFASGMGVFLIHRLAIIPINYSQGSFQWPMDLWVPGVSTFLSLFTSPHFIGATILIVFIFLLTMLFVEKTKYLYALYAGLAGAFLFSFHPFQVIKVFFIIALFFAAIMAIERKIQWRFLWFYLIFSIVSSPAILYYIWLLSFDSLTLQRSLQNINPTTPFYLTVISFGGLLFFALLQAYKMIKKGEYKNNKYLFLLIWAFGQIALLYAPISYQRRLNLGMHIPLAILTAMFMFYFYEQHKQFVKDKAAIIVVLGGLIFLPSTLFALSVDLMVFSQARELSYISQDEYDAHIWLKENSDESSIVFSSAKTGLVLSSYAMRTSYVAHAVETPFYRQKKLEPRWFFSANRGNDTEHAFLLDRDIDYLFFGRLEKEENGFSPEEKDYLERVYFNKSISIYKVL